MAPKTGISALKPNGYGEKKQVLLPKIDIISRKMHLLSNNSRLSPPPKKNHVVTPKNTLLPKKAGYDKRKKIASLSKKSQDYPKKKSTLLPNLLAFLWKI